MTASTHQPPSSAGPRIASLPSPSRCATSARSSTVSVGRVHPDLYDGPHPSRGPRRSGRARAARRNRRRVGGARSRPASRSTICSPEAAASRSPASATCRLSRPGNTGSHTASVSRMLAAASPAAVVVADVCAEPGLRLAGNGCLRHHQDDRPDAAVGSRQHPGEVARGPQRAPDRAGHLGPRALGTGLVGRRRAR